MNRYAPWLAAALCVAVIVTARLRTNQFLRNGLRPVPWMFSAFYMAGFIGLLSAFFWAMLSIAWWACLPVIGMYALTFLVRPVLPDTSRNPVDAHLAAILQATEELSALPPGEEKMQKITKRADEIMRSRGWVPGPQNSN